MQSTLYKLPVDSWVRLYPDIPESIRLDEDGFKRLWETHPVQKGVVNVFGEKETPRWHQTYGQDYSFSGQSLAALPIEDPYLKRLVKWANAHAEHKGIAPETPLNGILINWYENGEHYIGKHSDDERELVKWSPIYSFSFGQERVLRVRSKKSVPEEHQLGEFMDIAMPNNSLLIMGGQMQRWYTHEVPKVALSKGYGPRINITIRAFAE